MRNKLRVDTSGTPGILREIRKHGLHRYALASGINTATGVLLVSGLYHHPEHTTWLFIQPCQLQSHRVQVKEKTSTVFSLRRGLRLSIDPKYLHYMGSHEDLQELPRGATYCTSNCHQLTMDGLTILGVSVEPQAVIEADSTQWKYIG
jgi:hypothetical protein